MQDFRKLQVWRRGHELTLAMYRATATFPSSELYGLTSQIRRAAASIPANIAEGCGMASTAELGRFVQIAMGSASELEYHLMLAHDLEYLKNDRYGVLASELVELRRMLNRLLKVLSAAM
jgi:four helix bundle protein